MPCTDNGRLIYVRHPEDKKLIDRLTRLLCEASKVARREQSASEELLDWWVDHEIADRARGQR